MENEVSFKGNEVSLPRGNSLELVITPYADDNRTTEYILTGNDKVIFTVKSNVESSHIYVGKILTAANYNEDNKLILKLIPEDTVNLDNFCYVYDCALQRDNLSHDFYTFIKVCKFEITPALSESNIEESGE